jgi:hypothetical protein
LVLQKYLLEQKLMLIPIKRLLGLKSFFSFFSPLRVCLLLKIFKTLKFLLWSYFFLKLINNPKANSQQPDLTR